MHIQLPVTRTLYVATTNSGKLREVADAARAEPINILALPGLSDLPEPVEDALTFAGNAALKARAYSRLAPDLLVLADDSGLEVDALGGRPGVRSARFADDLAFEAASGRSRAERNNRCLLSVLQQLGTTGGGDLNRGARFVCALAVARGGEVLLRAEGEVQGEILDLPRGSTGFGYDPLFTVRARGFTLAELSPEQKWAVSHRGNAFRALLAQLRTASL